MATSTDRAAFRAFALDGAMLYFHPPTGTNVRVATAAARGSRRRAPRVAMFGVTNACNLACAFCSRDRRRDSLWTVETAAAALRGLAAAGTLEVAFGGGEPFAFRGFAELVAELFATTPLALHATTNGTLLSAAAWAPFSGRMGQVRVSIYDDERWRDGARVLADDGQRWGANVIVDGKALATLPARLDELSRLGCHDVSLLAYVGPDARRHLDPPGRERLAAITRGAPLPCRLSVCFGDRVPAPRLFDGADGSGDCGAGIDFVSITPDQRVQGCSFQDGGAPGATAEEILAAWRFRRAELGQPAWRAGCARLSPLAPKAATPVPPVAIWQAFSGNNSGECVLVARFETADDAEAYLAELLPGWVADEAYSPAWQELFRREGVIPSNLELRTAAYDDGRVAPNELISIGRAVFGSVYHSGDAFPELRALAWKRGARVTPGGIHVHDHISAVLAIRCRDADDARRVVADLGSLATASQAHGDRAFVVVPAFDHGQGTETLEKLRELARRIAGPRPLAADLHFEAATQHDLVAALQRLGSPLASRPRLFLYMVGGDAAEGIRSLAAEIDEAQVTVADTCLLVEGLARRKRLALFAYRRGARVSALDSLEVRVNGYFWHIPPPPTKGVASKAPTIDEAALLASVRQALPPPMQRAVGATRGGYSCGLEIVTDAPALVLTAYARQAAALGCRLHVNLSETDALAHVVRRLLDET